LTLCRKCCLFERNCGNYERNWRNCERVEDFLLKLQKVVGNCKISKEISQPPQSGHLTHFPPIFAPLDLCNIHTTPLTPHAHIKARNIGIDMGMGKTRLEIIKSSISYIVKFPPEGSVRPYQKLFLVFYSMIFRRCRPPPQYLDFIEPLNGYSNVQKSITI